MKDILSEIIANKRFEVDLQKQAISIDIQNRGNFPVTSVTTDLYFLEQPTIRSF